MHAATRVSKKPGGRAYHVPSPLKQYAVHEAAPGAADLRNDVRGAKVLCSRASGKFNYDAFHYQDQIILTSYTYRLMQSKMAGTLVGHSMHALRPIPATRCGGAVLATVGLGVSEFV